MTVKVPVLVSMIFFQCLSVSADNLKADSPAGTDSKVVHYSDFGAKGDGKTDDLDAIVKAHAFANEHGLAVKADSQATYYIGGRDKTAIIQTDTDFSTAKFIIDDRSVRNIKAHIFAVRSKHKPFDLKGVTSLEKNQRKINISLPTRCLVTVKNSNVKNYIRFGRNQNNGSALTDILLVDPDGKIDSSTPVLWDFKEVTGIKAQPVDKKPLTITGGHFTTIANNAESKYTYHARGIAIRRSNVHIDGLEHYIKGEGEHGAPYGGFINISNCVNVTVRDTVLTGHKTYRTIGRAGLPVSMGSYDISVHKAVNVSFYNCRQSNDIKDRRYWGILGSNYCKNLVYDGCTFSRFDAHKGVYNATIRNSTLGHMGINAIGHGTLTIENSTVYGRTFVNLRRDYGSTWKGDFVIRDCVFIPNCGRPARASLIGGYNTGRHDFGYTCYMPQRITIDTLRIDDSNHPDNYSGPKIFADINPELKKTNSPGKFPIVPTKKVIIKNVTTASGKPLRLSDNPVMFSDVKVKRITD